MWACPPLQARGRAQCRSRAFSHVGEDQDCCWHQELRVWIMWAPFEVWMIGDPAALGLHSPIHPADHTHTHTLFFGKGKEVVGSQSGRERGERTGGVEESADWRFLFNLASMTFFICTPCLFCRCLLLTSGQKWITAQDYKISELLKPSFSSFSLHLFVSAFLSFFSVSFSVSVVSARVFIIASQFLTSLCLPSLPALSVLSAAVCSFLHVVPPAGFLHQSQSPTYLILFLLISSAQPLFVSACLLFPFVLAFPTRNFSGPFLQLLVSL